MVVCGGGYLMIRTVCQAMRKVTCVKVACVDCFQHCIVFQCEGSHLQDGSSSIKEE